MLSFLGKHALQPGVPDPDAWVRDLVRVLDRAEVRARRHVRPPARARSPPLPFSARQVFTPQALVYVDADKVPDITPGKAHALAQAI